MSLYMYERYNKPPLTPLYTAGITQLSPGSDPSETIRRAIY